MEKMRPNGSRNARLVREKISKVLAHCGGTPRLSCFGNFSEKRIYVLRFIVLHKNNLTRFNRVLIDRAPLFTYLSFRNSISIYSYFTKAPDSSLSSPFSQYIPSSQGPLLFSYRILVCGPLQ